MDNIEKRRAEHENILKKYDAPVQRVYKKIAELEGNKSLRLNEKIEKIIDAIMQEVTNDN